MTTPQLSVVMPVFNGEEYLRQAVDSVLHQSFEDFEFIIVDDGSTDATSSILNSYDDIRIRIHRIEHQGLIPALNECIRHAQAPLLARMDADDLSSSQRFEKQIQFLNDNPEIGLVTCWCELIDDKNHATSTRKSGISDNMLLSLAASNDIVHGSVMIRRSSLPDEPIYTAPPEDYRLWIQLADEGVRFGSVREILYSFRTHDQRYSLVKARSQSQGIVSVQQPLLKRVSQLDIEPKRVRVDLIRGWGTLAGAAWRCGENETAREAYQQLVYLARRSPEPECRESVSVGYESIIWGGCPARQAFWIRLKQLCRSPFAPQSYKNVLLTLPFVESIRRAMK